MNLNSENLVNVGITCFNKSKYISEAIDSAIKQKTDFKFQILIVDDCSTDNSKEIISFYQRKYPEIIKVVFNDFNLGLIENFCKITKLFNSEYVAFLDADDYWIDENKLQNQVNFFKNNEHVGLLHTNYVILKGKNFEKTNSNFQSGHVYDKMIVSNLIAHSTVMVKLVHLRNSIKELEKLPWKSFYHNDYPLYLLLSSKIYIQYLNQVTLAYRFLHDSSSHTKNFKAREKIIDSTFNCKIYFIDNIKNVPNKIKKRIISDYYYAKLVLARDCGNIKYFALSLLNFYKFNNKLKYLFASFNSILKFSVSIFSKSN